MQVELSEREECRADYELFTEFVRAVGNNERVSFKTLKAFQAAAHWDGRLSPDECSFECLFSVSEKWAQAQGGLQLSNDRHRSLKFTAWRGQAAISKFIQNYLN